MEKRTKKILNEKAKSADKSNQWNEHEQNMARKPAIRRLGHSAIRPFAWYLQIRESLTSSRSPLSTAPLKATAFHMVKSSCRVGLISKDRNKWLSQTILHYKDSSYNFRLRESIYFESVHLHSQNFLCRSSFLSFTVASSTGGIVTAALEWDVHTRSFGAKLCEMQRKKQAASHTSSCAVVLTC